MLNNSVLRYKKDIHSDFLNDEIIDLLGRNFVIPPDFSYKLVQVSEGMTARPDLLSYHLYSDDGYGDLLCKLNDIQNPFEMNEGMVMVCPIPSDLWKFLANDTFSEKDSGLLPKPKSKKEKRRPNEATEDDVRYKVDRNRRIVVY